MRARLKQEVRNQNRGTQGKSKLGYHSNIVTRSLRSGKKMICDLRTPFFAEILQGIKTCIRLYLI